MRLFDFRCDECGRVFEELVDSADEEVRCPACGSPRATRQLSRFAIGRSAGGSAAALDTPVMGGGCAGGMCGL